jgi:hypothetical protein
LETSPVGDRYVAATHLQLAHQTGLSVCQVKRGLEGLRREGFVLRSAKGSSLIRVCSAAVQEVGIGVDGPA